MHARRDTANCFIRRTAAMLLAAALFPWLGFAAAGCGNEHPEIVGAMILTYKIEAADDDRPINAARLRDALLVRIRPLSPHAVVRGDEERVEIIVPDDDKADIDAVKRRIQQRGFLELRILANQHDHDEVIKLAQDGDPMSNVVYDEFDDPDHPGKKIRQPVAKWVEVPRVAKKIRGVFPLKCLVADYVIRDAKTHALIEPPKKFWNEAAAEFELWMADNEISNLEVLVVVNDGWDVTGDDIASVIAAEDEVGRPMVAFEMKENAAPRMRRLTASNVPEGNVTRQLGIVMDDRLLTAPTIQGAISQRGQITGKFTNDEVDSIVALLRSGALPAAVSPLPVEERHVDGKIE